MNSKTLTILGLVIALIAIIVSCTVPEIRRMIGLDKKTECQKVAEEILLDIEILEKKYISLKPTEYSYDDLANLCKEINSLKEKVKINTKCEERSYWQKRVVDFINLSHVRILEIAKKWDSDVAARGNLQTSRDLYSKAVILELTLSSKKFCNINQHLCDDKLKKAFDNILYRYEKDKFVVN